MKRKVVLGIDVSTSCTGLSVLDAGDGSLLYHSYVELNKKKKKKNIYRTIFEKATAVREELKIIGEMYDVAYVGIEAPAKNFKRGKTNTDTIALLLRFNGIIGYVVYELFGVEPFAVSVGSARKEIGVKKSTGKHGSKETKIKVALHFENKYDNLVLERTRFGNIKQQILDSTDSMAISWYVFKKLI
jgi:hypothetical protein